MYLATQRVGAYSRRYTPCFHADLLLPELLAASFVLTPSHGACAGRILTLLTCPERFSCSCNLDYNLDIVNLTLESKPDGAASGAVAAMARPNAEPVDEYE